MLTSACAAGSLELRAGAARRSVSFRAWEGVELPPLRAGEVLLLPPPKLKPLPALMAGTEVRLVAGFDTLVLRLGPEDLHPTVQ